MMQDAQTRWTFGRRSGLRGPNRGCGRCGAARMFLAAMVLAGAATTLPVRAGDESRAAGRPDAGATAAPTIVRLHATAVVTSDEVRLADLAELEGESARLVENWPVAEDLAPGESRVIRLTELQETLRRRGLNLSNWVFRGSSRCTVRRPSGAQDRPPGEAPGAGSPREDADRDDGLPDYLQGVDPDTLEAELRAYIARRLRHLGGSPVIRFNAAASRLLALSRPTYSFHISDHGDRLLGMVPLDVTITERDEVRQVTQVLAEVAIRQSVVVAARAINRGEVISSRSLGMQPLVYKRLDEVGLTDSEPLVGQRARRFIPQGSTLSIRDVEPVPLVRRNDLVTVWVYRGNLVIKGAAKALGDGGYGDVVDLKNEASQQTFSAVVTGPKTVELQRRRQPPPFSTAMLEGR